MAPQKLKKPRELRELQKLQMLRVRVQYPSREWSGVLVRERLGAQATS